MMYFASAIFQLYPTVVRTVGEDAFDADGNPVIYDRTLVEAEAQRMSARQSRAAAYAIESDPIFFKAQRGEATMDDWRTAVAAIQLSFPYPNEEAN